MSCGFDDSGCARHTLYIRSGHVVRLLIITLHRIFYLHIMLGKAIATSLLISSALAYPTNDKHNATTIDWAPCDFDFPDSLQAFVNIWNQSLDCATLSVPLDYSNSKDSRTIDLQLIRAKATKEPFKGSILTNPGGPGGSGVENIAQAGTVYGEWLGGHHDLIGFDPR
jgi:hypothetical protein